MPKAVLLLKSVKYQKQASNGSDGALQQLDTQCLAFLSDGVMQPMQSCHWD